jgi:cytochrome c peroxidase
MLVPAGCTADLDLGVEDSELGLGIRLDDVLAGVTGESDATASDLASLTANQRRGRRLFNEATFGGNGRTCRSCHPSAAGESGQLSAAEIQALFAANPADPLFQHDGADIGNPASFERLLSRATVQVTLPLPANVSIVGSDARTVTVTRSMPTTKNTPALDPVLMWDGRAPTLQEQARGAIIGHAQSTQVNAGQLDAIADFQTTLFNRDFLRAYANGGPAPELPLGTTALEIYGRTFFTPDGPNAKCNWCHSGPMLDAMSAFGSQLPPPTPEGSRFITTLVSELNTPGDPVQTFRFSNPDGTFTDVVTPDLGRALITGNLADANVFKIPTLWGVKDTAPYFHNSAAKDLEELMEFYDEAFRTFFGMPDGTQFFTDLDKAAIIAYLKLL